MKIHQNYNILNESIMNCQCGFLVGLEIIFDIILIFDLGKPHLEAIVFDTGWYRWVSAKKM